MPVVAQLILEGAPGVGKSTLAGHLYHWLKSKFRNEVVVLVNGREPKGGIDSIQGSSHLRVIYGPGKEENYHQATVVGFSMAVRESLLWSRWVEADIPVVNICERTSGSAAGVWLSIQRKNMRGTEEQRSNYYDSEWSTMLPVQEKMYRDYRSIYESSYADVKHIVVNVTKKKEQAWDALQNRGREGEAGYITSEVFDYMIAAHDIFFNGGDSSQGIMNIRDVYDKAREFVDLDTTDVALKDMRALAITLGKKVVDLMS